MSAPVKIIEDDELVDIKEKDDGAQPLHCSSSSVASPSTPTPTATAAQNSQISFNMVQIKAKSEDELMRRISAFMKNKRDEINERNIREFISPFSSDGDSSCARVEAVYIHRESGKSHISLKHVHNVTGPQTRLAADEDSRRETLPFMLQRAEAVEERLANMETHLDLKSGHQDINSRLKSLEKRISFLEGVSPEYFQKGVPSGLDHGTLPAPSDVKPERFKEDMNLSDINLRIRQLKEILQQRALEKDRHQAG